MKSKVDNDGGTIYPLDFYVRCLQIPNVVVRMLISVHLYFRERSLGRRYQPLAFDTVQLESSSEGRY